MTSKVAQSLHIRMAGVPTALKLPLSLSTHLLPLGTAKLRNGEQLIYNVCFRRVRKMLLGRKVSESTKQPSPYPLAARR